MSGVIRRLTRSWRRPRSLIIAGSIAVFSAGGLVAWAAWSSQGNGLAAAKSLSMPTGNTPTVSLSGTTVTVAWAESDFANGAAVHAYRVQRYAQGSATAITPGADCGGAISALTCAENAVPGGTWQYTVTPLQGTWTGAESPKSQPVTVSTSGPIATTTSVHSSGTPSVFGQLVTFTVTVSPAPPANETVSFADGATTLGSAPLDTSGIAILSTSALGVGSHTVGASYAGDSNFLASTGSTVQVVNKANTSVSLTSSDSSAVFGESVSFTATVTAVAPGAGTVDGTVQFRVDGVNLGGAVTLIGGAASSAATTTLSLGSHTVTAEYSGSSNFNSATGTLTQSVGKAVTTTTVTSDTNPSVFGQLVTFTATVSVAAPGAGTPGGMITFSDGSTTLGMASISGGAATFLTSALAVGSHTIGASYNGDPNFASSTAATITQTVGKANTTTVIASSVNPSVVGQGVIFTATVAALPPGAGSPSGTVQFHIDGSNFGSPIALLGGKAFSNSATALSVGAHSVTATYNGDANFNGSTSATLAQTVNKGDTATAVSASSANPSVFGQAVTFTAVVSAMPPGAGTPTGTVQFSVGAVNLGSPAALSGGSATSPSISSLPVGTSAITASYTGDVNFTGSASPSFTQVVNKDATTTTVASSANPSVIGQTVTFTATVSANAPGSGTPTGTVSFSEGATSLGTATVSGGTATFATSSLSAGNHQITASYGGDGNFLGSASSTLQQVGNQAPTTTTLSSSSNPSVWGQPVTFTANATVNAPGSGTPTGSVTFTDGATTLGSGTLNGGTATFVTGALSVATHTIAATYSGDGNFASSSTTLTQTVNPADSMTTLSASPTSAVSGQVITFTPTTTAVAPGAGTPTGLWWLYDGSTLVTGGSVNFALNIGLVAPGTHSMTAHYNGDGNFNGSISSPVLVTVSQASTTTAVTASSANPSVFGQTVTFTATVSAMPPGAGTPTGGVQFFVGGASLGTPVALSGGSATSPSISSLPVGTSAISASYSGDTNFTGSVSTSFTQTVSKDATSSAVASSANPSLFGQSVTFTATVSANSPGAGTPSGTVTFSEGATTLGTGTLTGGSASVTTATLSVGNHTISATYGGDGNFLTSAGSVLQAVGNQVPTTTTISSSANPSVWGQSVTFTATVTVNAPGSGTPTGTVTFTDGTTATLGSATLSAGGTATLVTADLSTATNPAPTHTITAAYSGDGNFASSNAALSQTVNQAGTTTSFSADVTSALVGQTVTFTATVSVVAPGAGTPSGIWYLYDGATAIAGGSILGTMSTSSLAPGTHSMTAQYRGDGNFSTSVSSPLTVTVTQPTTTTTLASTPNPSVFGQSVTFTATVAVPPPGGGTPTGTVTFSEGTTSLGTRTVDSTGTATLSTSSFRVGVLSITATYSGDSNFTASISAPLTQTINKADSATALISTQNPSAVGQGVAFIATVTAVAPGAGMPSGPIWFFDGSNIVDTELLDANGQAAFGTSSLTAGTHTITANYLGADPHFLASSGSVVQAVNQGLTNTTTTVVASANPSLLNDSVTFTATVSPAPVTGETLTFMDGTTTLGTGALSSGGVASFTTTSPLSLGSHTINAVYGGDATLLSSTGTLTQQVSRIIITPATAASNSVVAIRGAGWPANEAFIAVYIGPVTPGYGFLCYATADAGGSFSQTCTVSTYIAAGTYLATAYDHGTTDTGNQMTVTPAITYLTPIYANPTNTITVNGSGFAASSNITVTLGGVVVTPSVSSTSYLGQLGYLTFNVPNGATAGATTITVTDSASPPNSASIAFTVYNATIAISPTTVLSNGSVTVSGTGWPAFEVNIQVYIGPLSPGYGFACYATADATGAFSKSCPVSTNLAQGTYTATATDNSITVTGNAVTVNPAITYLTPLYANPTNAVTINGSGFAATANITVALGGVAVTPSVSSTNYLGGLGYLTFNVPSGTPAGVTTITVTDSASPPNSASIAFAVYHATIAISPTIVASNGSVTVSGTGWPANGTAIQVYLGPLSPGYGFLCYVAADGVGAFSKSCPVNQALAQGTYLATATDASITTTGNPVTVNPALTYVNPTYANPTNSVTINGSGFAADSIITVKLGSVTVASYTTNSLGGLSYVSFAVPNGTAPGPTTITVTDSASPPNSASIAFTVYNATIAISPRTAASGSLVTVSGTGWPANKTGITVYIGPLSPGYGFLCYAGADGVGAFSQSCTVNASLAQGTYTAVATDNSITVTGNAVTVTPAITLVSPTYANPTNPVTINASGFAASSSITIKVGSLAATPSVTSTDTLGAFAATFNVPSGAPAGATTIMVTDSASPPNSASIAFTVYNATVVVSPTTVTRGNSVTVTGTGWPANEVSIQVWFGTPGTNFLCYVNSDGTGSFSTSCPVSASTPTGTFVIFGTDYKITASGNSLTVN